MSIDEKRYPDERDRLSRQDAQVTQFGDQRVVTRSVQLYLQGQHSPSDLRETTAQIDGAALDGASATRSADQANPSGVAILDSGTNADDSIKVESNRTLDYAPNDVADFSCWIQRDSGPVDKLILRYGVFSDEDGLFFEETVDELKAVIRDGSGGSVTDTVLRASEDAVKDGVIDTKKSLLGSGRIWFIRFSHYGAGKVIFGTRESLRIDTRDPEFTEQIFLTYSPTKDELDRLYMRTANLPARVEIDNDPDDATAPSSALSVKLGDRQLSVFGDSPKQPRELHQQFVDLTAQGGTPTVACAIRPVDQFEGMPNGINITIEEVEITVDGGTNPVRFWLEVGPTITAGDFDDSDYTGQQSAAEIGLGDVQASGNITVTEGSGINVQPAGTVPVGTQGSASAASGGGRSQTPLGVKQSAVLWVEGQGGAATFDLTLKWKEGH